LEVEVIDISLSLRVFILFTCSSSPSNFQGPSELKGVKVKSGSSGNLIVLSDGEEAVLSWTTCKRKCQDAELVVDIDWAGLGGDLIGSWSFV
jgi:hypothetical protein